jgi:glycosyltransferase involved in cell wall biosynthesis
MRYLFLWTHVSGYLMSCLQALAQAGDDVRLVSQGTDKHAPFEDERTRLVHYRLGTSPPGPLLDHLVDEVQPDVVIVSGWANPAYMDLLRRLPTGCLRVMAMDNQWWGTPRQRLGSLWFRVGPRRRMDYAFVPGSRQRDFAIRLGFPETHIWTGLYACDYERFSRIGRRSPPEPYFLTVARLVPAKGIDVMQEAYRRYRALSPDPWAWVVAGRGPLAAVLRGEPGVQLTDFLQPTELASAYAGASCFVLPSIFEPWGVALQEAAAAGLPIICTSACGAAAPFAEDHRNGRVVPPGSVTSLATALVELAEMPEETRQSYGTMSRTLAGRFTPTSWADALRARVASQASRRTAAGQRGRGAKNG